ncbi:hypothetical protein F5B22DRAFT_635477 [Xylaria bambusicola]|uniref:uncharacterized protein n=1 Tax=Xylaria bambusicola TaxID=326684 RepID=UPI0020083F59|nr:uncharacterized protein F5B22DRAFT_635477 [Xylaria bambusicola]KAI0517969.1 hypothetical protein F5B22DRAFT_635477 [Xylaria bambusicola]
MATQNLRGRHSRREKPANQFKFEFQNDIAAGANGGGNQSEDEANRIVAHMREEDNAIFATHATSPDQHFLHVRDAVEGTRVFQVARMMPKGAHLHLHFNSTLLPGVLLGFAKDMVNMYIWSNHRLLTDSDFRDCKLEFSLRNLGQVRKEMHAKAAESGDSSLCQKLAQAESLSDEAAKTRAYDRLGPDMFSPTYQHGRKDKGQKVEEMRYQYFRERWNEKARGDCDEWLISKLTFSKEEVDSFFVETEGDELESDSEERSPTVNLSPITPIQPASVGVEPQKSEEEWVIQTRKKVLASDFKGNRLSARKAWRAFNGRTKMMKGLFNYETAFRRYTRKCLEEFVKDNVQYAEIRPNFMQTNQILDDSAQTKIDNFGTMRCIIEEYEKFMQHIGDMDADGKIIDDPDHRPTFSGMKVIYCTPRSFKREAVKKALDECIEMKKKWPDYIAGFDLVGEEAFPKPYPLRFFEEEFRNFRTQCEEEKLDIPFLFHCGETPDDLEGNLETALNLDAKRIGHGYALPEKPAVLRKMKSKNMCVETCPISNMVLGLAKCMDEHSVYRLLEEKMPCAVSSDNGTLFKSTLSHDFYEVMAGNKNINLYGWKQLARWSIEHSCLSPEELRRTLTEWEKRWQEFINTIIKGSSVGSHLANPQQLAALRDDAEAIKLAKL